MALRDTMKTLAEQLRTESNEAFKRNSRVEAKYLWHAADRIYQALGEPVPERPASDADN
jgi:hypothetical protein